MGGPCDVSVVIATYRREQLVLEAIQSALNQTGVSVEVIVVDDSGEATARQAVEGVNDERVRYIARERNSGRRPGLLRNDGAAVARARFIHFLDDDDRLESGALQSLVEAMSSERQPGMTFGRVMPFGNDAKVLAHEQAYFETAARNATRLGQSRLRFAAQLLFRNTCLINSACLVRRSVFEELGGYDSNVPIIEDVDFFLRVGRSHGFSFIDRPILQYRTGAQSITSDIPGGVNPEVLTGYQRMYAKYKERHGATEFYGLKISARGRSKIAGLVQRVSQFARGGVAHLE